MSAAPECWRVTVSFVRDFYSIEHMLLGRFRVVAFEHCYSDVRNFRATLAVFRLRFRRIEITLDFGI